MNPKDFMPRSFRSNSGVESMSISKYFCGRVGGTRGPSSMADEAYCMCFSFPHIRMKFMQKISPCLPSLTVDVILKPSWWSHL